MKIFTLGFFMISISPIIISLLLVLAAIFPFLTVYLCLELYFNKNKPKIQSSTTKKMFAKIIDLNKYSKNVS